MLTLSDPGLYVLRVTGDGSSMPNYQFQLLDAPPSPPDVELMNIGDVVNGSIENIGSIDEWKFTAAAGQSTFIDFQSLTLGGNGSVSYFLTAPDGSKILGNGGTNANRLDSGPINLPVAGTYTLRVEAAGITATYQFQLWDVPSPDVSAFTIGDTASGAIETPGSSDAWTFSGAAGQSIFIDFLSVGS